MKLLFGLGIVAFAGSFVLPVVKSGDAAKKLSAVSGWAKDMGDGMAKLTPTLGSEGPRGSGKFGGTTISFEAPLPMWSGSLVGHEAARMVFEGAWNKVRSNAPWEEKAQVVWVNLANPFFVIATLVGLLGLRRPAALIYLLGAASAGWWIYGSDLPTSNYGPGYWAWLASFVVAAVGVASLSERT